MKKRKYIISIIAVVVTLFWCSFCFTKISFLEKSLKQKTVKATISNKNNFDNDIKVYLKEKNKNNETQETLDKLKDEYNLGDNANIKQLTEALEKKGYYLDEDESKDTEYHFKKCINPNMYYILKYNDNLAIFKSNDNCQLYIEDQKKDIYLNTVKYFNLSKEDKEYFEDYNAEFSSKKDAVNFITQYIS